jgi:hypothetical protein
MLSNCRMQTKPSPKINFVDQVDEGVVVTFEDGTDVLFSAALLGAIAPQAEKLQAFPEDE